MGSGVVSYVKYLKQEAFGDKELTKKNENRRIGFIKSLHMQQCSELIRLYRSDYKNLFESGLIS